MKRNYPWIGKSPHNGLIVRFDGDGNGRVIDSGSSIWRKDDYRSSWLMRSFKSED